MNGMEFRLDPDVWRQYGMRSVGFLLVAVLLGWPGISKGAVVLTVPAGIAGLAAVYSAFRWMRRRLAFTRADSDGVETGYGFSTKRVAWAEISEIQVFDVEKVRSVGVRAGFRVGTGGRNSGGPNKKVAYVKLVRHRGRNVELAAPLVIRESADSRFDDKVRALRSAHAFYTSQEASPVGAASQGPGSLPNTLTASNGFQ